MVSTKTKLPELKLLCEKYNLPVEGTKQELLARLDQFLPKKAPLIKKPIKKDPQIDFPKGSKESDAKGMFLQLKISNVANYFNFGYIYPLALEENEIYKTENRSDDIITKFPEYILLATSSVNYFGPDDVLIEIIHKGLEGVKQSLDVFFVSQPIPTSRIKRLFFASEKILQSFLASINAFKDCFIPESLCRIIIPDETTRSIQIADLTSSIQTNQRIAAWKQTLDKFDKLLGMLAFMKNTGLFFSERENRIDEYAKSYFNTLALVNSELVNKGFRGSQYLRPLVSRVIEVNNPTRQLFEKVLEKIFSNAIFDISMARELISTSNLSDSNSREKTQFIYFDNKLQQLEAYTTSFKDVVSEKEALPFPMLLILFLIQYPNRDRSHTDKQAVRNFFISGDNPLSISESEAILGCLGAYYGYKNMLREDTNLFLSDSIFNDTAQTVQSIKFKMTSYLDRFTIESCMEFAKATHVQNDRFAFLDWGSEESETNEFLKTSGKNRYVFGRSQIFDYSVITVRRINIAEQVYEKIRTQFGPSINLDSHTFLTIKSHFKVSTDSVIDHLRKNANAVSLEQIEQALDLDIQFPKING